MAVKKYVDYDNEAYIWEKTKNKFVQKETGKGLSEANYTQDEKTKLAGIAAGAEVNVNADWDAVTGDAAILNKPTNLSDFTNDQDFVSDADYVHTDNNYTETEKSKLAGIAAGAEVNVQADWNATSTSSDAYIKNKPANLVQDANYVHTDSNFTAAEKTKLGNIAAGAEVNVQANWTESSSTSDAYIQNKPTKLTDFTNDGNFVRDANYTHITVDNAMSDSSTNPISNSVVKDYIDDAISSVTGIDFQKVDTLPATGSKGIIYLVPNSGSSPNSYDEYIWVTVSGTSTWEKIGTTDIDLSGYQLSSELIPLTVAEIDAICV